MSYVRLINQCGLYEDKIRIKKKNSGCGLYTGALNRPKITVVVGILVVVVIVVKIIMIAFKGQVEICHSLLTALQTVTNMHAQVARAQSCANHMHHIKHFSHTACRVPHGAK